MTLTKFEEQGVFQTDSTVMRQTK